MKIIYHNLKIKPENLDDLWYLKSVIDAGDLASGRSVRRVKDDTKIRADVGTRKPVFLTLKVEDVEFHRYTNRLRISGAIERGPEDLVPLGSHHTIEVKPHDTLSITKEWKGWQLDRLKEAEKSAKEPLVLVVGVEEGEAEFAIVRKYGVDLIVRITTAISGKRDPKVHETTAKEFYVEVGKKIDEVMKKEGVSVVILCGPGFTKENVFSFLKEKYPEAAEATHIESAGTGGRVGIQEVIKRGAIEKIVEESRVSYETVLVEKLFTEISKGSNLATYGLAEVENAIEYGAVDILLLSGAFLRKFEGSDRLIEKTKNKRGRIAIISTEHEAGERLEGIGGIAALLRFAIE
ncbi:MAG: mRNA surveillance protein pelota [Candidatus Hydrothermarchaeaceae archaeon]